MSEKIIEKINALRAKTPERGATEEEALAALEKASALMAKYELSEADLRMVQFTKDMHHHKRTRTVKQEHPVEKYCTATIAKFCGIRAWRDKSTATTDMFGLNEDIEMATYLMDLIRDSMNKSWKEYARGAYFEKGRHVAYWSFMSGFAARICQKINILIDARTETSSSTDLVVLKNALVNDALREMLPWLNLVAAKSSKRTIDPASSIARQNAGDKVNLNRPIQKQQTQGQKRLS